MKQQPPMGVPGAPQNQSAAAVGEFSTGLCDCFSDIPLCCMTFWCPCVTFGRVAEIVDRGSSSCGVNGVLYSLLLSRFLLLLPGCAWIYSCTYRSKMKAQYGIPENNCGDCCTHFWCEPCALCQEYRELQHRGYDVALGWHINMERRNQEMTTPPTMPGGMTR